MVSNIGPVEPVRRPGNSTSGQPNNQGNGKSNARKQQPKQPNSIFGDGFKKNETVGPQSGTVAPLGQPWNLDINGNPDNSSDTMLYGYLSNTSPDEGEAGQGLGIDFLKLQDNIPVVSDIMLGKEIGNYAKEQGVNPLLADSIGTATGIGSLAIPGYIDKAIKPVMKNAIKKIPFSDQTLLGVINRHVKGLNKPVTENVYDITNGMPTRMPPTNVKGQGTSHNLVRVVEPGGTFKKGDKYKYRNIDNGMGLEEKEMTKEHANILNEQMKEMKDEIANGYVPIYSDEGTLTFLPPTKYANDLVEDANLIEKAINQSYPGIYYDNSIANDVIHNTRMNKAAMNSYNKSYGEPLSLEDVYNHYSGDVITNPERGFLGTRAGDNLLTGPTGTMYLTGPETYLGGFNYRNSFLGPRTDSFVNPGTTRLNDLNLETSKALSDLMEGLKKNGIDVIGGNNPTLDEIQRAAYSLNLDGAFNRIMRQGGYAGLTDVHGTWKGRTTRPFDEYAIFRPEDLFYYKTNPLPGQVNK